MEPWHGGVASASSLPPSGSWRPVPAALPPGAPRGPWGHPSGRLRVAAASPRCHGLPGGVGGLAGVLSPRERCGRHLGACAHGAPALWLPHLPAPCVVHAAPMGLRRTALRGGKPQAPAARPRPRHPLPGLSVPLRVTGRVAGREAALLLTPASSNPAPCHLLPQGQLSRQSLSGLFG